MTLNADNVRVAVTGALYWDKTATAVAPAGISGALDTLLVDLGYVSEEGATLTMPGEAEATAIRAWQNGRIARVIRTPSEDQPTIALQLIETKLEVVEFVFGVEVTQGSEAGRYVIDANAERKHGRAVLDVIDGDNVKRHWIPKGIVTEVGEITYANGEAIGYQVTIECERDETLGGNIEVWETALAAAVTVPLTIGTTAVGAGVIA